ncbi:MAG: zinc ribbon domain-containing protein [Candidatus Asgardarchaeum sp.]
MSTFPFVIVRENDKWFCYVSIPVKQETNNLIIGIDFNLRKWVAAPYRGQPLFFDASEYSEKIDRLQRLISKYHSKDNLEKVKENYHKIQEIIKLARGNFLALIKKKYGICTIAIERISGMFKLTKKESAMINNWLYKKTALRKFVLRAMAKGFNVIEIDPRNTTKLCYRCNSKVRIYGKHRRLIRCDNCGLKD